MGSLEEDLYLSLCYDEDKEDQHEAVWGNNLDAAFVGPDGIILDGKKFLGEKSMNLSRALELFPEWVTNQGGMAHVEKIIMDILREVEEAEAGREVEGDNDDENGYSKEVRGSGEDALKGSAATVWSVSCGLCGDLSFCGG